MTLAKNVEELFADYHGRVAIKGDVLGPTGDEWETV